MSRIFCQAAILCLCALLPAGISAYVHPRKPLWSTERPAVIEIELSDAAKFSVKPLWVDARGEASYMERHVPSAVLLNEDKWDEDLPQLVTKWQPGVPVLVYCDSQQCHASQQVALRIRRELHIDSVFVLKGGWAAWLAAQ